MGASSARASGVSDLLTTQDGTEDTPTWLDTCITNTVASPIYTVST